MSTLAVPPSETSSQALSRSSSVASSVASAQTTHSFLPVIEHEDLFSASFVLGAVAESPASPPRAPYLRPISTFNSPKLPVASSSSSSTPVVPAAFSPSLAGMRSTDTLVSVVRQPCIASVSTATQLTTSAASSRDTFTLPPTRPLVISHQKRSLRQRLSLSRPTPPPPMAEPERTKRAFSLPFNLPSHSTVSLVPSLAPSTTSTTSDLPNLLLPEADIREVVDEEAEEDASWVPPPPPVAKGQSEAPVKGKGGPGWYGGKRINKRGEVVQVAADGTETVIMKRPSLVSFVRVCAA
jgi:hypothetical protein